MITSLDNLEEDLSRNQPVIRVRVLPGIVRNLALAIRRLGPSFSIATSENDLAAGLPRGWSGDKAGYLCFERLMLKAATQGMRLGDTRVEGLWESEIFDGSNSIRRPRPEVIQAEARIERLPLIRNSGEGLGWKKLVTAGGLSQLKGILGGNVLIFVGSPRTWSFAKFIGVSSQNFLPIPDKEAYTVHNELEHDLKILLSSYKSERVVMLHTAGLAGNTLMLSLADSGYTFWGIDFGISSTITDLEYMTLRPWFKKNRGAILRARREILNPRWPAAARRFLARLDRKQLRTLGSFSECARMWPSSPELAFDKLRLIVRKSWLVATPILESQLLVWSTYLRRNEGVLLIRCLMYRRRVEPILAASMALDLRGFRALALTVLGRARSVSKYDHRLERWTELLTSSETGTEEKRASWETLLSEPGQNYLGSSLSWSLLSDLPSGMR